MRFVVNMLEAHTRTFKGMLHLTWSLGDAGRRGDAGINASPRPSVRKTPAPFMAQLRRSDTEIDTITVDQIHKLNKIQRAINWGFLK